MTVKLKSFWGTSLLHIEALTFEKESVWFCEWKAPRVRCTVDLTWWRNGWLEKKNWHRRRNEHKSNIPAQILLKIKLSFTGVTFSLNLIWCETLTRGPVQLTDVMIIQAQRSLTSASGFRNWSISPPILLVKASYINPFLWPLIC